MIVNRAMIDYATLTSFSPVWLESVRDDFRGIGRTKTAKFQQYEGEFVVTPHGSVAITQGLNRSPGLVGKFVHHVVKFSGEIADSAPQYYAKSVVNVKRIDIQVTVPCDLKDIPVEMDIKLRHGKPFYKGKGRRIIPHLRRSDTSTLYYGSRTGDKFFRLYEKQSEDGKWYLRWEYELKRKMALWAMERLVAGDTPGDIFTTLVGEYNDEYERYVAIFLAAARGEKTSGYVREKNRDTMSWMESLTPTVERLLMNHQTRYRCVSLLIDWYNMAVNADGDSRYERDYETKFDD